MVAQWRYSDNQVQAEHSLYYNQHYSCYIAKNKQTCSL